MLITLFIDDIKTNICNDEIFKVKSKLGVYRAVLGEPNVDDMSFIWVISIDFGFIEKVTPSNIYKLPDDLKMVCTH